MTENLGVDGPIERYSRGLDTWVPLDSEGSFAAMKRSIEVQRRAATEGHTRARVLLRIKSVAKTEPTPATQASPPLLGLPPINVPGAGVSQQQQQQQPLPPPPPVPMNEGVRMSFRPFASEPPPMDRSTGDLRQSHQGPPALPPPPPPPFGMPPSHMRGPEGFHNHFRLLQGPPSGMHIPPPPPPPPPPPAPFPFEHRHGFFPPMSSMLPPPRPANPPNGGFVPHSMPLPPLVPERPLLPMRMNVQPERSPVTPSTHSTTE